jgi:ribosomal protein S18 acetylase RimI-like enzyme
MTGNCVIRLFEPDDFSPVCELEQGDKGSAYSAAVFVRQASVLFAGTFYVAAWGGAVVGFTIGAVTQADPREAWVLRLRVAERYQRRSIGRDLLTTLLSAFAVRQVRRVLLTVAPGNQPALNLYRSMGFKEFGFLGGCFGPGEDRLILSADLAPER